MRETQAQTEAKIAKLNKLAHESAARDEIFTTALAIRETAILSERIYLPTTDPRIVQSIESMWKSHFAVRNLFKLHVDQQWNKYYRSLDWWQRFKKRKFEWEWKDNQYTILENRAERDVYAIVDGVE
jgi:hypothetical protein